jgi:hypothetical protein
MKHRSRHPEEAFPVHVLLAAGATQSEFDLPCRDIEDALNEANRLEGAGRQVVAIAIDGYRIEPDEFATLRECLFAQRSQRAGRLLGR